jgi:hypothetical protein
MKAFAGCLCVGLVIFGSGCNQKSDTSTASAPPTNTIGNPLTAPADYLGVVVKAKTGSEAKIDLISLNNAVQQYQALEGHLPATLDEMVKAHYYPRITPAPTGMKYDYNPATGKVSLVPAK